MVTANLNMLNYFVDYKNQSHCIKEQYAKISHSAKF